WTDLIAMGSSTARLLINDHGKLVAGPAGPVGQGPLALADLANRSLADLIVGDTVYRNTGNGRFERANVDSLPRAKAMAVADLDGDGRTDLAMVAPDGSVILAKNITSSSNRSMNVRLEGVKNLKVPTGAVVEVKAGAWYQKQTYQEIPLVFGLRDYAEV